MNSGLPLPSHGSRWRARHAAIILGIIVYLVAVIWLFEEVVMGVVGLLDRVSPSLSRLAEVIKAILLRRAAQ